AVGVRRAMQRARSVSEATRGNIVSGGKRRGAEIARGSEQVAELDGAVALDAGDRRFAMGVAVGEIVDHGLAEAAFVIQHVMRDADRGRDIAGIVNVAPGAAGALAMGCRAMVVKLQRDADDVVALRLQQRSRHRRVDAAGHGDHDTGVFGTAFEIETVAHGTWWSMWPRAAAGMAASALAGARVWAPGFLGKAGASGRHTSNIGRHGVKQSAPLHLGRR